MIDLIKKLFKRIGRPVNLMEVCGTHTVAIFRSGIRSLLPEGLRLLSGPGCPVCVTSIADVDRAVAVARSDGVILATFGDMMRVPGSKVSLSEAKAEGADVRIVYSPLDCLDTAAKEPGRTVVFFSAGFETTVPSVAATVDEAERRGVENFLLLSVHKLVPPALEALLQSGDVRIDGFLLPGHVSTIIGTEPYEFIGERFGRPGVVTGFSAEDILSGIALALGQIADGKADIEIQYRIAVTREGNRKALAFMDKYFERTDSTWRGIGVIPGSGLRLRERWLSRDAAHVIHVGVTGGSEPKGCLCGLVLRGIKIPPECPLFGKTCTPEKPVGACMVSTEGSCAAYYRYGGRSR